jgi:two-component system cell cycle response regulator
MSTDINLPLWLAFLALNEHATHDWLTGLHNRRYFEATLANHIEVASRYGRDLSLVLFDLDRFKQINDTHGHDAGDDVLRQFATLLKASARKADIVCRYGGDEFAVILPETGTSNAWKFVGRVVGGISDPAPGSPTPATLISATAGVAALPSEHLVADADADLLARKRAR